MRFEEPRWHEHELYERLQKLGVNVNELRRLKLSLEDLNDMVNRLDRLSRGPRRTFSPVDT